MSSSSNRPSDQPSGATTIQKDSQVSYMVATYFNAEPNIHEQVSGVVQFKKGGENRQEYYEDKAKKALDNFDKAWNNAR
ncbi:hypothetical protein F4815DRAFT_441494 [Daldinia loculata]|nr:hypothetical protein F4815DRAFT_441494 [Daldinia loculata]